MQTIAERSVGDYKYGDHYTETHKSGLIVPKSRSVARENLKLVSSPQEFFNEEEYGSIYSKRYTPVSYHDIADRVMGAIESRLGKNVVASEKYTLKDSRKLRGAQILSVIEFKARKDGDDSLSPIFAWRSSNDKSFAWQACGGTNTSICANMELFSGDVFERQPHIGEFWTNFDQKVHAVLDHMRSIYKAGNIFKQESRKINVSSEEGARILGEMVHHGNLSIAGGTNSQLGISMDNWKDPKYEVFEDRNLWSLYNALTEGKKRAASFAGITQSGNELREYFVDRFALPDDSRVACTKPEKLEEDNED